MKDVDYKLEALRIATLIMCQSATAGKGDDKPKPSEVLDMAKTIYEWAQAEQEPRAQG